MKVISQKLRDSARGQNCTFCIPGVCNRNPATTVLAHIHDDYKGMGNKAADYSSAFACSACHDHYDQHRLSREDELFYALRAMQRTWMVWIETGLVTIPVDQPRQRQVSKVLPRRHPMTGEII